MKSVTVLALAALAACAPALPPPPGSLPPPPEGQVYLPHKPGTPYPSLDFQCLEDDPNSDYCGLDETLTMCKDGVATVYNCVGGCQPDCPVEKPCTPICKEPFNGVTWKYVDDGNFFHY